MAHTDFIHQQPSSPADLQPDLDEHLRTYALFRKWAIWGAFGAPVLLAFVLYWTV